MSTKQFSRHTILPNPDLVTVHRVESLRGKFLDCNIAQKWVGASRFAEPEGNGPTTFLAILSLGWLPCRPDL
jgi:hypothetical protein